MIKHALLILLIGVSCLTGCGKVGLKDPVALPGLGETFGKPIDNPPAPKFVNGDVVIYKLLSEKRGMIMQCDYKYIPRLKTWYCIVDFYPSSAIIRADFSDFDNYERRYVYEFELAKEPEIPARWAWIAGTIR